MTKQEILDLIANGKTKQALGYIKIQAAYQDRMTDYTHKAGRYNVARKDNMFPSENTRRELTLSIRALIHFVDEIYEEEYTVKESFSYSNYNEWDLLHSSAKNFYSTIKIGYSKELVGDCKKVLDWLNSYCQEKDLDSNYDPLETEWDQLQKAWFAVKHYKEQEEKIIIGKKIHFLINLKQRLEESNSFKTLKTVKKSLIQNYGIKLQSPYTLSSTVNDFTRSKICISFHEQIQKLIKEGSS